MKRLNKEYILLEDNSISVKYGSVNKLTPKVIYINLKTWIQPTVEEDYHESIKKLLNEFKFNVKKTLYVSKYFEDKTIYNCDINLDSLTLDRNNFLSIEFYIKQKNDILSLQEIKDILSDEFNNVFIQLVQNFNKNNFITHLYK